MMMVVVVVVMAVPIMVMMVVVVMVMVLRELNACFAVRRAALLIHRLQDRAGVWDGLEQVGVGTSLQHVS